MLFVAVLGCDYAILRVFVCEIPFFHGILLLVDVGFCLLGCRFIKGLL
jgi:hypothetical protein